MRAPGASSCEKHTFNPATHRTWCLATGDTPEAILADFPSLTLDDVRAKIAFAAASAEEDLPTPAVPRIQ